MRLVRLTLFFKVKKINGMIMTKNAMSKHPE